MARPVKWFFDPRKHTITLEKKIRIIGHILFSKTLKGEGGEKTICFFTPPGPQRLIQRKKRGSYNFQGVLRRKVWRFKWRLGYTLKNEVTNFLIWYTKVLFNPLKHFQKIEVTDLQKLGYYWIFVLSINVNKSEIFKQNLFVWNPQMKMLGLVWYIL